MLQRKVLEAQTSGIFIVMGTDGSQAIFSPGSSQSLPHVAGKGSLGAWEFRRVTDKGQAMVNGGSCT